MPDTIDYSQCKSQFGEDKLLFRHFNMKKAGYYVEVGACDGIYASNTFFFEKLGWGGLLIEPVPDLAAKCRAGRANSQVICCAAVAPNAPDRIDFEAVQGWPALSAISLNRDRLYDYQPDVHKISVAAKTLDAILIEAGADQIDFISIDVEGYEWQVLQGFTISRWRPEIIILERWSALPDQKIMKYMHSNNYVYMRTTGGINDWFHRSPNESETADNLNYRLWLFLSFYLPAYAIHFAKTLAKSCLTKFGSLQHGDG